MDTLILKLVLTPALIGIASLAGRRWGSSVSGWLVGLPFTGRAQEAPSIYGGEECAPPNPRTNVPSH